MSLTLKSVSVDDKLGDITFHYEVSHSSGGGRSGTSLDLPLQLIVSRNDARNVATFSITRNEQCDAATPEEALSRLAQWLNRAAEGIADGLSGQERLTVPIWRGR